jgi:hypothetical protein
MTEGTKKLCICSLTLIFHLKSADITKRFIIETFFSDQKTKGFQLHRSKVDDPERIIHLLIAACLAYIFLLLVGLQAINHRVIEQIHRKERCDWSLFTIGKRAFQYLVDQRVWYKLNYKLLL